MADASTLFDLTNPSTFLLWIAIVLSVIGFGGYFAGRRALAFRKKEIGQLSLAVEQLTRLSVLEYRGIVQLSHSLASALNPTGDNLMTSPEAKAAYQALGQEPERIMEEAQVVLSQVAKTLGWRHAPGFQ